MKEPEITVEELFLVDVGLPPTALCSWPLEAQLRIQEKKFE